MSDQRKPSTPAKRPASAGKRAAGVPPNRSGRGGSGGGKGSGRKRGWSWGRFFKIGLVSGLVLVIIGALGFVFVYNSTTIPDPNKDFQTQTTHVFFKDGKTDLGNFVQQNRDSIKLSQVPKHVQDAVIAAEDRSFYTNQGIDPRGILRAAFSNAQGNSTQGASTITQQYVKILYLSSARSLKRKIKEAFVSLKLQKQQSKQQILEGYLNTIYFGRGAYGIQAAAQAYFKKDAKALTVQEGAVLASVLNSPANFDPANGAAAQQRLLGRYRYVLSGMAQLGNLDAARADRFSQALPKFPVISKAQNYAHQNGFMLEMVRSELHAQGFDDATIDGGGLRVTTTFSKPVMADIKNGVLSQRPPGLKQLHIGATSIDVKTGAVRGIYGGQDYLKSAFNWALRGGQPGSSFKPFALATGIKAGFSLKDTFQGNSPYVFPDGLKVQNEGPGNGNNYGAQINLLKATEQSVNTAYVDLTASTPDGPKKILATAAKMGIPVTKTALKPTSLVALGTERVGAIDMANAYATIANKGVEHPWYVVEKVVRASDNKTLYTAPHTSRAAISPAVAADVSFALQDVVQRGTGTAARAINRPAAGKTGTATNDKNQVSSAWFIGYTPQTVTAVMYVRGDGNNQLDGWLPQYFGGAYPARTWAAIMSAEMQGLPVRNFPPPANLDGKAPTNGHAPFTPKPTPTKAPKPTPTKAPKPTPSKAPKPTPSPTPTPTPTPSTPPSPSPTVPVPGGGNSGGGPSPGPGGRPSR
ncbi:MAG: transglycosylase domain-containing protein [Marmoricola sp.]